MWEAAGPDGTPRPCLQINFLPLGETFRAACIWQLHLRALRLLLSPTTWRLPARRGWCVFWTLRLWVAVLHWLVLPVALAVYSLYFGGWPDVPEDAEQKPFRPATLTTRERLQLARALMRCAFSVQYRPGDCLIFDNTCFLHSEMPGSGERLLRVGMANPIRVNQVRGPFVPPASTDDTYLSELQGLADA
eukprot:5170194-Prymnesium_polylepis.1